MIEYIRQSDYVLSDSDVKEHSWAEWAFQSHDWIEEYSGYFRCKLCNTRHTNSSGIGFDTINLCLENPILKKMHERGRLNIVKERRLNGI